MKENELQTAVIDWAHLAKWRVAHFRSVPVLRSGRVVHMTPVQADGRGFPDLVMVRRTRLIVAELKTQRGVVSEDQNEWLEDFRNLVNGFAEVYVWRPQDWTDGTIQEVLR